VIPTRAAVAVVATIAGLVLLLNFKTPDTPVASGPRPGIIGSPPSAAPSSSSSSPASCAAGTGPFKDGTFTGQDVPNRFGDVQVQITISCGRITDVTPLQMPNDRQRSYDISTQAAPLLHDEALQAQSAQIDLLSGATYTSDSYARSLQSALDQAR
jgi:uncharacterized protein with FMN-binding domain